jgi:hypothetical protein
MTAARFLDFPTFDLMAFDLDYRHRMPWYSSGNS